MACINKWLQRASVREDCRLAWPNERHYHNQRPHGVVAEYRQGDGHKGPAQHLVLRSHRAMSPSWKGGRGNGGGLMEQLTNYIHSLSVKGGRC